MTAANRFGMLALLLTCASAYGGEIKWADAVREASDRNSELRAARFDVQSAEDAVLASHSGFLPQVSAGVTRTNVEGNAATSTSGGYSASITATQNLFSGFQDSARVRQAQASRDTSLATLAGVRARLSLDLKSAYAGLLYAQENIKLTARIVQRLEENVRLIELRYESGRENRGSLLLTRANLAQARYEQLQAQQSQFSARSQLARVLGRDDGNSLAVVADLPVGDPGAVPDFEQLLPDVPDYQLALAQEKAAAAGLLLARSGFYPSLNLSGGVSREGPDWYPDGDRRTLTASVTVPLFNGGRDYYSARSSAATVSASAAFRENVERVARQRLQQTFNVYLEATEKQKVDDVYVEAAETRAQIARGKYNNGLMTFEDWDRIEADLIQRYKTALAGKRERILAEAAWEQAQGKGVIP